MIGVSTALVWVAAHVVALLLGYGWPYLERWRIEFDWKLAKSRHPRQKQKSNLLGTDSSGGGCFDSGKVKLAVALIARNAALVEHVFPCVVAVLSLYSVIPEVVVGVEAADVWRTHWVDTIVGFFSVISLPFPYNMNAEEEILHDSEVESVSPLHSSIFLRTTLIHRIVLLAISLSFAFELGCRFSSPFRHRADLTHHILGIAGVSFCLYTNIGSGMVVALLLDVLTDAVAELESRGVVRSRLVFWGCFFGLRVIWYTYVWVATLVTSFQEAEYVGVLFPLIVLVWGVFASYYHFKFVRERLPLDFPPQLEYGSDADCPSPL